MGNVLKIPNTWILNNYLMHYSGKILGRVDNGYLCLNFSTIGMFRLNISLVALKEVVIIIEPTYNNFICLSWKSNCNKILYSK